MLKVEKIYVFVAQNIDGEGVMAAPLKINGQTTMMPLVAADKQRAISLFPIAKQISRLSNTSFKVYQFDSKIDVTEDMQIISNPQRN
jgi:hypothetical protein